MRNAIEIRGLSRQFEDFALRDISLTLPGGSIMGLIGENGAGKTTTIRCILGLLQPDQGEISVLGYPIPEKQYEAKQDIGVVMDECFFHDTLRPSDLNGILGPAYKTWDRKLFGDYLKKFNIPAKKTIKEFSRGMKMKLSLAAALAHRPRLLILDEATAGLDPVVRDEILDEFLGFIQDEDHSILISSHITSDLEKVADYVTYIHEGRVVIADTKDAILEHYGRVGCTARQLSAIAPGDILRLRRGDFGCEILVADRRAFHRRYPDLPVDNVSLEEIMLFLGRGEAV